MSTPGEPKNTLPSFERAKRENQDTKPIVFEIEGETFSLAPKIGTRALEAVGRATKEDPTAMFDFLDAMMVEDSYERFLALDLDVESELPAFVEFVMSLYGDTGKAGGSAAPS